jgi:hypothetical protein
MDPWLDILEFTEDLGLGESWLLEHIRHNVFRMRLNRVITAVGPPGSGKSWTGLRIGRLVDPTFGIERVVFPGLDYIRAIADPNLGIGAFVEWDDAGLGAPAREFWSLLNRAVGMVAQSSRFRRLILWVTLPDKSFLDAQPRKLVDVHLEFMKRDSETEPIAARVYLPETNAKTGKIYYKHPRIDNGHGPEVLDIIRFKTPPEKELADAYEDRKARYMMAFYKGLLDELETGGIAMTEHQAMMFLVLDRYRNELGKTKGQAARAIGIRPETYSRALKKARMKTGFDSAEPPAEA